jgi:signal recognition particle subunit SRP54
MLECENMPY